MCETTSWGDFFCVAKTETNRIWGKKCHGQPTKIGSPEFNELLFDSCSPFTFVLPLLVGSYPHGFFYGKLPEARLQLVMKSGKYSLGLKTTLKTLRRFELFKR